VTAGPGKGGPGKGNKGSGRKPGGALAGSGSREASVRVKSARGRSTSSARWLQRQLNDPYVAEARRLGYRSRAAFKLIELDRRFHLLRKGLRVLDLGAAPGGWTQVAVAAGAAPVVALDRSGMEPMAGARILTRDIDAADTPAAVVAALGGPADLVLSDMAPAATGHAPTDHLRIVALCESALALAEAVLAPGGAFVAKVLQGGTEGQLLARLKTLFAVVRHAKPPSSRSESAEMYVVATGFRPPAEALPEAASA